METTEIKAKALQASDKIKIQASVDSLPLLEASVTSDEGEAVFNLICFKYRTFKELASQQINTL